MDGLVEGEMMGVANGRTGGGRWEGDGDGDGRRHINNRHINCYTLVFHIENAEE